MSRWPKSPHHPLWLHQHTYSIWPAQGGGKSLRLVCRQVGWLCGCKSKMGRGCKTATFVSELQAEERRCSNGLSIRQWTWCCLRWNTHRFLDSGLEGKGLVGRGKVLWERHVTDKSESVQSVKMFESSINSHQKASSHHRRALKN